MRRGGASSLSPATREHDISSRGVDTPSPCCGTAQSARRGSIRRTVCTASPSTKQRTAGRTACTTQAIRSVALDCRASTRLARALVARLDRLCRQPARRQGHCPAGEGRGRCPSTGFMSPTVRGRAPPRPRRGPATARAGARRRARSPCREPAAAPRRVRERCARSRHAPGPASGTVRDLRSERLIVCPAQHRPPCPPSAIWNRGSRRLCTSRLPKSSPSSARAALGRARGRRRFSEAPC